MKLAHSERGVKYYLSFLLILVIICFSFYPTRALPIMRGGVTPYFVGIVLSVLCVPSFFKNKCSYYVLAYVFVVFLNHFLGNKALPTIGATLTESIGVFLPAVVFFLSMTRKGDVYNKLLLYSFLIILGVFAFQSYQLDQMMPGIIRSIVHMEDESEAEAFLMFGLAPYALPHALPVLIPPCVMAIKGADKKYYRVIALVSLICVILLVSLSQSFGAFVLAFFTLLLSLLVREGGLKRNAKVLIISTFFVLLFAGETVQVTIIEFFRGFFDMDSKMYEKLTDLLVGVLSESDQAVSNVSGSRGNLLELTIQAILRNPLFGVNDRSYGNHNALLDRWACFGLVGFIPLILFIYNIIKLTIKQIPYNIQTYYVISVISSLIMMSTKNMMGWYQWVCFVLVMPLMFFVWKEKECFPKSSIKRRF